ncbi:calcium-binding protein [Pseudomonas sp. NPDC085632]|uniref:calcium-binding protein n=1 Tax=Pseudomonas sp. NPDC085632 TaxID=3364429 RepID=UPI0037C52A69
MATMIRTPSLETAEITDAVVITDMRFESNEHNASTIDFNPSADETSSTIAKSKASQLQLADSVFGPLQIGSISITRASLDALGASFDGQPLNGRNTFFRAPKRSFINSLQFSAADIERYMKSSTGQDSYLLTTLLFEMASERPLTAPHLIRESSQTTTDHGNYRSKLVKLLGSAQRLDLYHANLPKHNPRWVAVTKSYATLGSSVGIQGFGIFMGLRGVVDAIKADNTTEVAINSVGIGTEVGSIVVDIAVSKIASNMLSAGQGALLDFAKTRFALRLGRSGGLIGGALTLPFDIFTAVRSINAAENATGKEAMDHYVSAGLSITSAAMTVILGTAALAGFSFAGPVGLAAGAILAIGSQIYGAVRVVDDIDDYIELTLDERWRTGWFSFCMMEPDEAVQNRYLLAKTRFQHAKQLKETARKLLDGQLKDTTEAIVNGQFEVNLKPSRVRKRNWWTKQDSWETIQVPEIKGVDDVIDARDGVTKDTPGAELGTPAENKGILWFISEGEDTIQGVENKPNSFHYRSGTKQLTGGEKNDRFVFEGAGERLGQPAQASEHSTLKGGEGIDTLILGGGYNTRGADNKGYDVDLTAQTLQIITTDPSTEGGEKRILHSVLESIENVETVSGALNVVTGSAQRNVINSRGEDTINAGSGNDQIHLSYPGAIASGESGIDEYIVEQKQGRLSIIEDGTEESIVLLNWKYRLIDSWTIENGSLIIRSRFPFTDDPNSLVVIRGIYKKQENHFALQNNKLTFLTKDGYSFRLPDSPELPEHIENDHAFEIQVIVVKKGTPEKPIILHAAECRIDHQNEASYYLPRSRKDTTFWPTKRTEAVIRLHLDYHISELTKVEARFGSGEWKDNREFFAGCNLQYHFGENTITFKNFSYAEGGADPRNMIRILRTMALRPNYRAVLIFKEGVTVNVQLTPETDVCPLKSHNPYGFDRWTTPLNLPLPRRKDQIPFELPVTKPFKFDKAGCGSLFSYPEQTSIQNLEGTGSTYLIHLVADIAIRLSTPGALANSPARLPYSSTWDLDATALGKVEIKLENNQLHVGTCIVHLPEYDSEDLIDQVRVITEKGVVHTVDLSFDRIYMDGLDARFFAAPDPTKALPEAFAAMANNTIKVRNIVLADNRPGTLSYNFPAYGWILRSDKSRVEYSDLQVINYCSHQGSNVFAPPPLMNMPPA